ncbi:MAG TPA: hypothetical protein QGF58_01880 [Myxococcota bacterium]|nr:hypothetical protein [Myxococcota bacterium]
MISRVPQIRRSDPEASAVHVWGAEFEECAVACELAGCPVVRLESGGFFSEWNATTKEHVLSGQFRVAHEILAWTVVTLRELGRSLFKAVVVDQEEDEYSRDPAWGTEDFGESYEREMARVVGECAQRMRIAMLDEVLSMAAWRVFDRQRGILTARYGLGAPEQYGEVQAVLDKMGVEGVEREHLRQVWIASQAWW